MITIKNRYLTVKIKKFGAQLSSIVCDGVEYMWGADPAVWGSSAPIMFPVCGGLKDDKYLYGGKQYNMIKHGFSRVSHFETESVSDDRAVLLLKANEQTKEVYPFDFELRVIFELTDNSVRINYQVDNNGTDTMYFNIGAHEGYATPEGIEDYDIIFDDNVTLQAHRFYGELLCEQTHLLVKNSKFLPLYDKYFYMQSLPFTNISFNAATLRNRKTEKSVRVEFPDAKHLLLWHKHGAGYICIEPWNGLPDVPDSSYDITQKKGITALDAGHTYCFRHTISIGK